MAVGQLYSFAFDSSDGTGGADNACIFLPPA